MWVDVNKVVRETERASLKGNSSVIPGFIYKLARPFLGSNTANKIWRFLSKRN